MKWRKKNKLTNGTAAWTIICDHAWFVREMKWKKFTGMWQTLREYVKDVERVCRLSSCLLKHTTHTLFLHSSRSMSGSHHLITTKWPFISNHRHIRSIHMIEAVVKPAHISSVVMSHDRKKMLRLFINDNLCNRDRESKKLNKSESCPASAKVNSNCCATSENIQLIDWLDSTTTKATHKRNIDIDRGAIRLSFRLA